MIIKKIKLIMTNNRHKILILLYYDQISEESLSYNNLNQQYAQVQYNIYNYNQALLSLMPTQFIMSQFKYQLNDQKLKQDVKLLQQLKKDFHLTLDTQVRRTQRYMLDGCAKHSKFFGKDNYQTCMKFTKKIIEPYKKYSQNIIRQVDQQFYTFQNRLKANAYNHESFQAFFTVVDFQKHINKAIEVIKEDGNRLQLKQFDQNLIKIKK